LTRVRSVLAILGSLSVPAYGYLAPSPVAIHLLIHPLQRALTGVTELVGSLGIDVVVTSHGVGQDGLSLGVLGRRCGSLVGKRCVCHYSPLRVPSDLHVSGMSRSRPNARARRMMCLRTCARACSGVWPGRCGLALPTARIA